MTRKERQERYQQQMKEAKEEFDAWERRVESRKRLLRIVLGKRLTIQGE